LLEGKAVLSENGRIVKLLKHFAKKKESDFVFLNLNFPSPDILIDPAFQDLSSRPRALNNKGVLSLHRLPKAAYFALRTIFVDGYFGLLLPENEAPQLEGVFRVGS
jgi:hypothetical protein